MTQEEQLLSYLKGACRGRAHPAGSEELKRSLDISGTTLRKIVNRLRRRKIPIASDRTGYFYAQTAGEVYTPIRQLRKIIDGLEAAILGLEQSLNSFGGGGDPP